MTKLEKIQEKIKNLRPEQLHRVEKLLISFERKSKITAATLNLGLRGALKDFADYYTSVKLQHNVSDWIVADASKNSKK